MKKMRADLLLCERGHFETPDEAARFIMAGKVRLNADMVLRKPSEMIDPEAPLLVESGLEYVSRGAFKLLDVLDESLDLSDWHYSFLLNGFLDRYLFDHGFVVKKYDRETFEEVRSRSLLNGHVKQYWKGYDPKRIADPAYRDDSYSKLLFEYYGK